MTHRRRYHATFSPALWPLGIFAPILWGPTRWRVEVEEHREDDDSTATREIGRSGIAWTYGRAEGRVEDVIEEVGWK